MCAPSPNLLLAAAAAAAAARPPGPMSCYIVSAIGFKIHDI
jgi:hypothetical protein